MNHNDSVNPYLPPGSDVNAASSAPPQGRELAERGTRLAAASIDGALACVPLLPMLAVGIYVATFLQFRPPESGGDPMPALPPGFENSGVVLLLGATTLIGMFGMLGLFIYQWVLISRTGQTLGKKWTGIRIELLAGAPVNFVSGVLLRNWLVKLVGMVPWLGGLFQLVDVLFIFREDRRCIHDLIAGTRVVRVER
jgi:uncharacterized RDD family membrane protein YckC